MIKRFFFGVMFVWVVAMGLSVQLGPQQTEIKTYELYSWQDAKGKWTFGLFPAITSAGLHPDVIMRESSALTGPERLKRAIAALPAGSDIIWLDHAVGMWKDAKGWEHIKFPPDQVIAGIRKYCDSKGYKLDVAQKPKFEEVK
jgi:hypothetical protein